MRIQLVSIQKLPAARRQLRRSGIRLTVRYGQVYTIRAVEIKQPDSEAQLRMRNIMAQASALAKKELEDCDQQAYWASRAAEQGYKTARGACVAHHIKQLRAKAATETEVVAQTETTTATLSAPAKTTHNHTPRRTTPTITRRIWHRHTRTLSHRTKLLQLKT